MRESKWFDALVLVFALSVGFQTLSECHKRGWTFTYTAVQRADDQVVLPTCETCKLIDPDHCWTCWLTYYGNGCYTC